MIHELKPKSSRSRTTAQKLAATESRSFRTFLLMRQFAAKEIGQRIAQARRLSGGMTQRDLADALGVGLRSAQDYEAGSTIPWKHFQQLAAMAAGFLTAGLLWIPAAVLLFVAAVCVWFGDGSAARAAGWDHQD